MRKYLVVVAILLSVLVTAGSAQAVGIKQVIRMEKPYVNVKGHHATEHVPQGFLTRKQVRQLVRALQDYNKSSATTSDHRTNCGRCQSLSGSGDASDSPSFHGWPTGPPDCDWSWRWTNHWYGMTTWENDCLAKWTDAIIYDIANFGGTITDAVSVMQFVMQKLTRGTIAAILGALAMLTARAMNAQIALCEHEGYGGVGAGMLLWFAPYLYC